MKHLLAGVGCTLTWSKRVKIALDAAKGLAFLHGAERSVIYRDLKTANILLDEVSLLRSFVLQVHRHSTSCSIELSVKLKVYNGLGFYFFFSCLCCG